MHVDHKPDFENLADRLRSITAARPIVFVVNPGNWGDALIREGAEQFLRFYEFDYASVHLKDLEKRRVNLQDIKRQIRHDDPVMVYNGCGAFSSHYTILDRVQKLANHFSSVALLPCTINTDMGLNQFPSDTHIFVRDRFESQAALPSAPFCHDMAFFLDLIGQPPEKTEDYFFRDDREAPLESVLLPDGVENRDLSKEGKAQHPVDGFIRAIAQCETVHTNRLHVGIAAALLGRQTNLSANDYFKIRAIYDSSISSAFPNVDFTASPQRQS